MIDIIPPCGPFCFFYYMKPSALRKVRKLACFFVIIAFFKHEEDKCGIMSVSNEQCQSVEEKNPCLQDIFLLNILIVRSTHSSENRRFFERHCKNDIISAKKE